MNGRDGWEEKRSMWQGNINWALYTQFSHPLSTHPSKKKILCIHKEKAPNYCSLLCVECFFLFHFLTLTLIHLEIIDYFFLKFTYIDIVKWKMREKRGKYRQTNSQLSPSQYSNQKKPNKTLATFPR